MSFGRSGGKKISRPIIRIAVLGIGLGLAVMILAVSVLFGFKREIEGKVTGFGAHILVTNLDANYSYQTIPISRHQQFSTPLDEIEGIKHVQEYAIKPGIIKTENEIEGIIVKGVGPEYDWSRLDEYLVRGRFLQITDTAITREALISETTAKLLGLDVGDEFRVYFISEKVRGRKLEVSGIYKTGISNFDKLYIFADIKDAQKLNNWEEDQITGFELIVDDYQKLEQITENVRKVAAYRYKEDGSSLKVENVRELYVQVFDWMALQDMNIWIILILLTAVAGINMISGLLILILERTGMIGILKTLGYNNSRVRRIFLYIGTVLIMRGLFIGNVIGIGLALLQKHFKFIKLDSELYFVSEAPIFLDWLAIIVLNAAVLLSIVLMLVLPSMVISRIRPSKTIRFK